MQSRKRNLDICREREAEKNLRNEVEQVTKRIRGNPNLYHAFPSVPAVAAWLEVFRIDQLRYPLLILLGRSHTGKTEFAKSLFKNPLELKVGNLVELFPSKIQEFQRRVHDAIIMDDVRDLQFVVGHQEKLQGKYDSLIEFATTQGGTCFYAKYLFQVPIVVAINYTTKNLGFLEQNDWLATPANRVVVQWPPAEELF